MKKMLLIVLLVVVLGGLAFVVYMGAFETVTVGEQEQGPYTLVYREITGNDMKQVGDITNALDKMLSGRGVASRKPLGVYYPDGHAQIGFSVEGALPEQLAEQAKVRVIPASRCMVANFPWHNKLSFVFGYMKIEPAFTKYREQHNYKKVEAYVLYNGDSILYVQPIVQQ